MNRFLRGLVPAVAVVLGLVMTGASAHAVEDTAVATIVGQGTTAPGLSVNNAPQSVSFTGVLTGLLFNSANPAVFPMLNCAYNGASVGAESLITGFGTGVLNCFGTALVSPSLTGGVTVACDVSISRVTFLVALAASCDVTISAPGGVNIATPNAATAGVLAIVPTSVNPVTTFSLAGALALTTLP